MAQNLGEGIVAPEVGPKSFRTFEKQSQSTRYITSQHVRAIRNNGITQWLLLSSLRTTVALFANKRDCQRLRGLELTFISN